MNKVEAPFTPEQVRSLNAYQQSGVFHPFTCSAAVDRLADHSDGEGILVAYKEGWMCPDHHYAQTWAWAFMADGSWRKTITQSSIQKETK